MDFENSDLLFTALQIMSALFIFVIGLVALAVVITFILDITQSKQAIRRNYPVIGRFRYPSCDWIAFDFLSFCPCPAERNGVGKKADEKRSHSLFRRGSHQPGALCSGGGTAKTLLRFLPVSCIFPALASHGSPLS